ncbi:hypothetical protein SAMN05216365_101123 [Porphyromonadaceae bacterium NLAE-zl-C104]|jgi:hypothetical protein|nr:hypothetical protein SAMN05216331_10584 [Porphyromonadaceae bacterium KH3R12]SFS30139.1 hypothetical protein SAMN05216365_101123 [Porphyromonadaceae bacterium NLAE-zl-C104]
MGEPSEIVLNASDFAGRNTPPLNKHPKVIIQLPHLQTSFTSGSQSPAEYLAPYFRLIYGKDKNNFNKSKK